MTSFQSGGAAKNRSALLDDETSNAAPKDKCANLVQAVVEVTALIAGGLRRDQELALARKFVRDEAEECADGRRKARARPGVQRSTTLEFTLLTFCPPGPPDLENSQVNSSSGIASRSSILSMAKPVPVRRPSRGTGEDPAPCPYSSSRRRPAIPRPGRRTGIARGVSGATGCDRGPRADVDGPRLVDVLVQARLELAQNFRGLGLHQFAANWSHR